MGVLVHPNDSSEKANGVAVTKDPRYQSTGSYSVNTQIVEDPVTNPGALSVPEEVLLPDAIGNSTRVQASHLAPDGQRILSNSRLSPLRSRLIPIHAGFRTLYKTPASNTDFAMEIEFKITRAGAAATKQARPWVN